MTAFTLKYVNIHRCTKLQTNYICVRPIPVTYWSNVKVRDHRLLGLRFESPSGSWMSLVNVLFYQVEVSATGRSLFQKILPTVVVCHSVQSGNLKNEATLARVGLLCQSNNDKNNSCIRRKYQLLYSARPTPSPQLKK